MVKGSEGRGMSLWVLEVLVGTASAGEREEKVENESEDLIVIAPGAQLQC